MPRGYQVEIEGLKIIATQALCVNPPTGEGYELVCLVAIAERLEALVEAVDALRTVPR